MLKHIATDLLDIAYDEQGDADGWPVVLLHGFPYDIHAYEEVAPRLTSQGARVITPYLRGYGPTRFLAPTTLRSGQQAALASRPVSATRCTSDWPGHARRIRLGRPGGMHRGSALSVESAGTGFGQRLQHPEYSQRRAPADPEKEYRMWYQYYLHGERGRAGLTENRRAFCRLLWTLWSPTWRVDDDTYARSAAAFDNPDFVDVVVHSYRHRFGLVDGDPQFDDIERRLSAMPSITVPTITLEGDADGVSPPGGRQANSQRFTGRHQNRVVPNAGHNLPQEAPEAFADAVLDINAWAAA